MPRFKRDPLVGGTKELHKLWKKHMLTPREVRRVIKLKKKYDTELEKVRHRISVLDILINRHYVRSILT